MRRYTRFVLASLLAVAAAQAGATNLIQNGDFSSGFDHWTLGTTADGTAGQGFPQIAHCDFYNSNCWFGQVGEVNSNYQYEGATLAQTFSSSAGPATLSFSWEALYVGYRWGGGEFRMILDGVTVANQDAGYLDYNQWKSGQVSANVNLTAGQHTLEIEVLNNLVSFNQAPIQGLTAIDVEGNPIPEPGSLAMMCSGVLGLAGVLRRKIRLL